MKNIHIEPITNLTPGKSIQLALLDFVKDISDVEYKNLLLEVIVRFNTEPKRYEKKDFDRLIKLIVQGESFLWDRIKQLNNLTIDDELFNLLKELIIEKLEEAKSYCDEKIDNLQLNDKLLALRTLFENELNSLNHNLSDYITSNYEDSIYQIDRVEDEARNWTNEIKEELDYTIITDNEIDIMFD